MSVDSAKRRLLQVLDANDRVTTADLETLLERELPGDILAAVNDLEAHDRVIVLRETGAPRGLNFTGLLRLR